jgi:Ca2+-binding RTX toxin-like protein
MARFRGTSRNDTVTGVPSERNFFDEFGIGTDSVTGGRLGDVLMLYADERRDYINGSGGGDLVDYSGADRALNIHLAGANLTGPGQVTAQFGMLGSISDPLRIAVVTDLVSIEDVTGSRYADQIHGSNGDNTLDGGGSADTIYGYGGADTLIGGNGNDTLDGGGGNDTLRGGSGADVLRGGLNVDTASYADSPTAVMVDLNGGFGDGGYATGDTYDSIEDVIGSDGADDIRGDYGTNRIHGGDEADSIYGRSGNDFLHGDGGNDTLFAGWGSSADYFDGGDGIDTLSFKWAGNSVWVSLGTTTAHDYDGGPGMTLAAGSYEFAPGVHVLGSDDTIVNVENVIGSFRDDFIIGSDGDNLLAGGTGGNDTIDGAAGNDTIMPGVGGDHVFGGPGIDTVSFADRSVGVEVNLDIAGLGARSWDLTTNGAIVDGTVDDLHGIENITGSQNRDSLWGDGNGNIIDGGSGDDRIYGKNGDDTLIGGEGVDFLKGGQGNDVLTGGSEADTFYFDNPTDGVDTVTDFQADGDTLLFFDQTFGFGIQTTDLILHEGAQLINSANPTATVAQPTFLFNTTNQLLYFDPDGTGSGAPLAVVGLPDTTHLDYLLIG